MIKFLIASVRILIDPIFNLFSKSKQYDNLITLDVNGVFELNYNVINSIRETFSDIVDNFYKSFYNVIMSLFTYIVIAFIINSNYVTPFSAIHIFILFAGATLTYILCKNMYMMYLRIRDYMALPLMISEFNSDISDIAADYIELRSKLQTFDANSELIKELVKIKLYIISTHNIFNLNLSKVRVQISMLDLAYRVAHEKLATEAKIELRRQEEEKAIADKAIADKLAADEDAKLKAAAKPVSKPISRPVSKPVAKPIAKVATPTTKLNTNTTGQK